MPVPYAALAAQQTVIASKMTDLQTAIVANVSDDITAAKIAVAVEVAKLPLILFQDPSYAPATVAGRNRDLCYEIAFALAPSF